MPSVIGIIDPFRSRAEAKTKSDQAHRNANRDTVTIELRLTGRMIERNVRHVFAPSLFAAWISSSGIPDMKAVNSRTPNGTATVESATIRPTIVLSHPSLR